MRIIFMGSPEFAVPSLNALIEAGHDVVAAYAQPPRPAGRGKSNRKNPVHVRAEALGIEVRTPRTLRDAQEQSKFAALDADLAVVAAYGLILPKPILTLDQVKQLAVDNVVSEQALGDNRTLESFGITPSTTTVTLTSVTVMAAWTACDPRRAPKATGSARRRSVEPATIARTARVLTRMPPAADPTAPPTNMRNVRSVRDSGRSPPRSSVVMPVLRAEIGVRHHAGVRR